MKTLCPSCNTINSAVGFDLSDKEISNLRLIGLSEHLCKSCYNNQLSTLLAQTKSELAPLNKRQEETRIAYYEAYEAWKAKAALYKAIDYNMNLDKFETAKKEKPKVSRVSKSDKPINIESLANQLLAELSPEQRDAILRSFQN